MCIQLGPEFHSLEEEDLNTDVYKKKDQKSSVWKDKIRIPKLKKKEGLSTPMFGRIRSDFQYV